MANEEMVTEAQARQSAREYGASPDEIEREIARDYRGATWYWSPEQRSLVSVYDGQTTVAELGDAMARGPLDERQEAMAADFWVMAARQANTTAAAAADAASVTADIEGTTHSLAAFLAADETAGLAGDILTDLQDRAEDLNWVADLVADARIAETIAHSEAVIAMHDYLIDRSYHDSLDNNTGRQDEYSDWVWGQASDLVNNGRTVEELRVTAAAKRAEDDTLEDAYYNEIREKITAAERTQREADGPTGRAWRTAAAITYREHVMDYGNDGRPEDDLFLSPSEVAARAMAVATIAGATGVPEGYVFAQLRAAAVAEGSAPGSANDPDYLAPPNWETFVDQSNQYETDSVALAFEGGPDEDRADDVITGAQPDTGQAAPRIETAEYWLARGEVDPGAGLSEEMPPETGPQWPVEPRWTSEAGQARLEAKWAAEDAAYAAEQARIAALPGGAREDHSIESAAGFLVDPAGDALADLGDVPVPVELTPTANGALDPAVRAHAIDAARQRVTDAAGSVDLARAAVMVDSLGALIAAEQAHADAVAELDALLTDDDPAPVAAENGNTVEQSEPTDVEPVAYGSTDYVNAGAAGPEWAFDQDGYLVRAQIAERLAELTAAAAGRDDDGYTRSPAEQLAGQLMADAQDRGDPPPAAGWSQWAHAQVAQASTDIANATNMAADDSDYEGRRLYAQLLLEEARAEVEAGIEVGRVTNVDGLLAEMADAIAGSPPDHELAASGDSAAVNAVEDPDMVDAGDGDAASAAHPQRVAAQGAGPTAAEPVLGGSSAADLLDDLDQARARLESGDVPAEREHEQVEYIEHLEEQAERVATTTACEPAGGLAAELVADLDATTDPYLGEEAVQTQLAHESLTNPDSGQTATYPTMWTPDVLREAGDIVTDAGPQSGADRLAELPDLAAWRDDNAQEQADWDRLTAGPEELLGGLDEEQGSEEPPVADGGKLYASASEAPTASPYWGDWDQAHVDDLITGRGTAEERRAWMTPRQWDSAAAGAAGAIINDAGPQSDQGREDELADLAAWRGDDGYTPTAQELAERRASSISEQENTALAIGWEHEQLDAERRGLGAATRAATEAGNPAYPIVGGKSIPDELAHDGDPALAAKTAAWMAAEAAATEQWLADNAPGFTPVDSHDRMVERHDTDQQYTVRSGANPWNTPATPDERDSVTNECVTGAQDPDAIHADDCFGCEHVPGAVHCMTEDLNEPWEQTASEEPPGKSGAADAVATAHQAVQADTQRAAELAEQQQTARAHTSEPTQTTNAAEQAPIMEAGA